MADIKVNEWQEWNIDLEWFTDVNANADANVDFNLTNVSKIYIGFGERYNNTTAGGYGIVYFDSISLYRPKCIAGTVVGDSTGDCTVSAEDFADLVDSWGAEALTPTPIIDLDANTLSEGAVTTWVNSATPIGGQFNYDPCDGNTPVRETVSEKAAVTFDGNDYLIADFNAPGGITGANDFTVIMNVFNPTISDEEMILTWATRGGPASTTAGVGYGSGPAWGAVVHWNAGGLEPDMGYDGGVPPADSWHEIAIAYEGGTSTYERVWVDGVLNAVEGDKVLRIYADQPVVAGCGYDWDPNETDPNDFITTLPFSGSVSRIRVYDEALPGYQIEYMATGEFSADLNGDDEVDFKDLAVVINNWLITKEWP
jgi:hypothetical protein